MDIHEEVLQIRQMGMEKAAAIWETLEHLPQPIDPVNIFKAVSSIKCAEYISRTRNHRFAPMLMQCVVQFLEDTINIIPDDSGEILEGKRALVVITAALPVTDENFDDAVAAATRQHVYDSLLLLTSVRMGKEAETKQCLETMEAGVAKALIMGYLRDGLINAGIDLEPDIESDDDEDEES